MKFAPPTSCRRRIIDYVLSRRMGGSWLKIRTLPFCFQKNKHARAEDVGQTNGTAYRNKGRPYLEDRKSTRLNSSHANISYAVFCLKKKNYIRLNPTSYSVSYG